MFCALSSRYREFRVRTTSFEGPPGERLGSGTLPTRYTIDDGDRIVSVGGNWNTFAIENGAPELQGDAVIGTTVFDAIRDAPTVWIYMGLYRRVREGSSVSIPLRCDSPTMRRELVMALTPAGGGCIDVEVRTARVIPTPFVPFWLRTSHRVSGTIVACGWCKRVRVGQEWTEPDVAVERLDLFEGDTLPQVSHGICPLCEAGLLKTIG